MTRHQAQTQIGGVLLLLFVGTASLTSAQTGTIVSIDSPNGPTYNPDADFLCATNRDTDNVTCVHMGLLPVRWTVAVGHLPNGIAYNPASGHLYVANYGSDDVTVLDGSSGAELATIPVGSQPAMVAVNPSTNKVYVTLHGEGRLAVNDGVSDTLLTFVDLNARGPYGVAVDEPSIWCTWRRLTRTVSWLLMG